MWSPAVNYSGLGRVQQQLYPFPPFSSTPHLAVAELTIANFIRSEAICRINEFEILWVGFCGFSCHRFLNFLLKASVLTTTFPIPFHISHSIQKQLQKNSHIVFLCNQTPSINFVQSVMKSFFIEEGNIASPWYVFPDF